MRSSIHQEMVKAAITNEANISHVCESHVCESNLFCECPSSSEKP